MRFDTNKPGGVSERREPLGTPIESAPIWALGLVAFAMTLVTFPGLTGIADVAGLYRGDWGRWLGVSAALSAAMTALLKAGRPWRRDRPAQKPPAAKLIGALLGSVFYPFALQGILAMILWPARASFGHSVTLGLVLAGAQALASLRRRSGRSQDE
jgi:hypothetical protein